MPVSMDKRVEAASVSLTKIAADSKIDLGNVAAQVTVSADRSGSAAGQWPDVYQEAIERGLALTLTGLDDDGVVPFIAFDHGIVGEAQLSVDGANGTTPYENFIREFHDANGSMGGTAYAPVIEKLLSMGAKKKRFGKGSDEANDPPFLHLFFTDGEPSDRAETERMLAKARKRPHFFQFILVGGDASGERFLRHLSEDITGDGIDNVGLTIYSGHPPTDDTGFFNDTIREFFLDWLPAARQQGITKQ